MGMGFLIGLIAILSSVFYLYGQTRFPDAMLHVLNRELAGARVADPPSLWAGVRRWVHSSTGGSWTVSF